MICLDFFSRFSIFCSYTKHACSLHPSPVSLFHSWANNKLKKKNAKCIHAITMLYRTISLLSSFGVINAHRFYLLICNKNQIFPFWDDVSVAWNDHKLSLNYELNVIILRACRNCLLQARDIRIQMAWRRFLVCSLNSPRPKKKLHLQWNKRR